MVLNIDDIRFTDSRVTFSGDISVGGRNLNFGFFHWSQATGLTAKAGGGQAGATQLSPGYSIVSTVASANDSVLLYGTYATAGVEFLIKNAGANTLDIYPASGQTIDALGANNPLSLAAGGKVRIISSSATTLDSGW